MASSVEFEFKTRLVSPVLVVGFPGVGNVGGLTVSYIIEKSGANLMASFYSDVFPAQVIVDEDSVPKLLSHDLWHMCSNGRDILLLTGPVQPPTSEGQYSLSEFEFSTLLDLGITEVISIGGYTKGQPQETQRILGLVSDPDMKPSLEEKGVVFVPNEPMGGVVGGAAMFLGLSRRHGIRCTGLMGETFGLINDFRSASQVVSCLCDILDLELDQKDIKDAASKVELLNGIVPEGAKSQVLVDLSYIG